MPVTNRRAFLRTLAAIAVGATLDPERLLWTPTKTIFVPPAAGWAPLWAEQRRSISTAEIIELLKEVYRKELLDCIANRDVMIWESLGGRRRSPSA